ncbi:DUF5689 domain-containing protein [Halpernia frigidisoli]|uniref:DUF5689 domain-containing protein n=1 Tax=Halpernia frigidisoli TaxID=1125876 RepID=A0A1I3HK49_9FLAO|nr:DUF5689 domain-containing protein [Halpernia frigidisoli]SFI36104.1 hypothetical protein SAMN05443292_2259 [Halpernia frigidisoli]
MKIKIYFKSFLIFIFAIPTLNSCVRNNDFQTPPLICNNRFDASTTTMAAFVATAPANATITIPATGTPVIFDAYVISSDENGNFYKTISIQDRPENPTVGLQMEVDRASNYADFPVGSHIRIKANGLVLGTDHGTIKIGSVDPVYAIGRIPASLFSRYISGVCNGSNMEIVPIVPTVVSSLSVAKNTKYLNTLVVVNNLKFAPTDLGKTYLDYVSGEGTDTDRNILDAFSNKSIIRNSAFFIGGKKSIPAGSGSIIFVVSRYNFTWQNIIRSLEDVKITN